MIFQVYYNYLQSFLPSSRHKNVRKHLVQDTFQLEIQEVSEEAFSTAFLVKNLDDTRCLRAYNGKLYKQSHENGYISNAQGLLQPERLIRILENRHNIYWRDDVFDQEKAIILYDNKEERQETFRKEAENYVICKGELWEICSEPVYSVNTFGFGGGHGGTGLFIDYSNSNSYNQYFTALQKKEAIEYAHRVAKQRHDLDSFEEFESGKLGIEVLMPEMVKVAPHEEHYPVKLQIYGTIDLSVHGKDQTDANKKAVKNYKNGVYPMDKLKIVNVTAALEPKIQAVSTELSEEEEALEARYYELIEGFRDEGSGLAYGLISHLTELSDDVSPEDQVAEYNRILGVFTNTWNWYQKEINENRRKIKEIREKGNE